MKKLPITFNSLISKFILYTTEFSAKFVNSHNDSFLMRALLNPRRMLLLKAFEAAVTAVHPVHCLVPHLPVPPKGRLIIIAAGKGAADMAFVAENYYRNSYGLNETNLTGIAVTRYGYADDILLSLIKIIEAGHPVPDANSIIAADQALALAQSAKADDLVLVLLSGGGSALLCAPVEGLSLEDKQNLTHTLLRSGAAIHEINIVRKHLSRIKGGRLTLAAAPAPVVTLAISDVPNDDPAIIGSGLTVADASTLEAAHAILRRRDLDIPPSILNHLSNDANETPKPVEPAFWRSRYQLIASPRDAINAAKKVLENSGYETVELGANLQGEARSIAASHAALALELKQAGRRVTIVSGGELTVTVRGQGRGGRNQEYALALAMALNETSNITCLAADTDGADGGSGKPDDPAGAIVDDTTLLRARQRNLNPQQYLDNNDSTGFFEQIGDCIITGPTRTNVNDCRLILVDPTF